MKENVSSTFLKYVQTSIGSRRSLTLMFGNTYVTHTLFRYKCVCVVSLGGLVQMRAEVNVPSAFELTDSFNWLTFQAAERRKCGI